MSLQLVTAMTCVLFVEMVEICYSVLDVLKHFIQVGFVLMLEDTRFAHSFYYSESTTSMFQIEKKIKHRS